MFPVVFNLLNKDESEIVHINPAQVVTARYTCGGMYAVKMVNGEILILDEEDFKRVKGEVNDSNKID